MNLRISLLLQGQLIGEKYSDAMDIKESTPLISWSLAKSVTSAIVGVRTADSSIETDLSPFQLATTPVWNASEVKARNITGEPPTYPAAMFGTLILLQVLGIV